VRPALGWADAPAFLQAHLFPADIIHHLIWLYARFTLSFRDVEEMLAERSLAVSYETVRRWFLKFGSTIAANLRRARPRPSDHWHLDEMVVVIRRKRYWLWRDVDNEGEVLDVLIQSRRDAKAARKLMKKLLRKHGFAPSRIVTDKLRSYPAAFRAIGLVAEHDRSLGANYRTENSHQPIRRRERKMRRFKSPGFTRRFLSIHAATYNTFHHQRRLNRRSFYKGIRTASFDAWKIASADT
jgi:putative transposase